MAVLLLSFINNFFLCLVVIVAMVFSIAFFCFLEKIPSSILFIPVFLRASRQLEPPI